jgi:hypothetical protein
MGAILEMTFNHEQTSVAEEAHVKRIDNLLPAGIITNS